MKADSPAFQFYPKDWLSDPDVSSMTLDAKGAYITLLAFCWLDGSLPNDDKALRRMAGATAPQWRKIAPQILKLFSASNSAGVDATRSKGAMHLRHKRLDKERDIQRKHREKRSLAGKRGAKERWQSHPDANANTMAKNSFPSPSPSPLPTYLASTADRRESKNGAPAAPEPEPHPRMGDIAAVTADLGRAKRNKHNGDR